MIMGVGPHTTTLLICTGWAVVVWLCASHSTHYQILKRKTFRQKTFYSKALKSLEGLLGILKRFSTLLVTFLLFYNEYGNPNDNANGIKFWEKKEVGLTDSELIITIFVVNFLAIPKCIWR